MNKTLEKIIREWDSRFGCKHKIHQEHCNFCQMKVFIIITVSELIKEPSRTGQQNKALYKFLTMLADSLNDSGKDMRIILKPTYFIPWTKDSAHDHLWVPIQKAMYGTEKTRELKKIGQIDKIHEVIMRELGKEHGIEYIPWPSYEYGFIEKSPLLSEEVRYQR